jgi:DNA-binding CsgD family transcriptional regulator
MGGAKVCARPMRHWNLHKVEEAFTAAAIDPARWMEALACVAAETDSTGALLLPVSGDRIPNVPVSEGLARANETYFRDGWHRHDQRYHGVAKMCQAGVADDLDCVSADEIRRHPFYQEFLAPRGLRWFAGVNMQAGDNIWCVSINRSIARGPFSAGEKRQLARLSHKLAAAGALSQALGFATSSATLEAFDVSGTAAVLLDRQAQVIRTNRAADRLLRERSVRIVGRHLVAGDPAATATLNRALHELLWTSAGASLMPAVALPRPSQAPILAYPLKLPTLSANPLAPAQAAVVLIDPRAKAVTPEASLKRAFGLTQAEARLASRMAAGASLEQICDRLGIAKETGRNQLKSIFAKTGVNRQAELVLLMSRML